MSGVLRAALSQPGVAAHDEVFHASQSQVGEPEYPSASVRGISADGSVVAFHTNDPLLASDVDDETDLYVSRRGELVLASPDADTSDSSTWVELAEINSEGTKVWFETRESLTPDDREPTFENFDVFEFDLRTRALTLVSTGPTDTYGHDSWFHEIARNGDDVYFGSRDALTDEDVDGTAGNDVYLRRDGVTRLISTGPADTDPTPVYPATWVTGISADGERVFFGSYERLVSADVDESIDIYERSGGETHLISTGPFVPDYPEGDAEYGVPTPDGRRVVFITEQKLVPEDDDGRHDVYQRIDRTTTRLVTPDPLEFECCSEWLDVEGQSPDGRRVFFISDQRYVAGDADNSEDAYVVDGSEIKLVAGPGANAGGAFIEDLPQISPSGDFAAFVTGVRLISADDDQQQDVYVGDGDEVRLVSDAPGVGGTPDFARFRAASRDLSRIFFSTGEPISQADTDPAPGLYEYFEGDITYIGGITNTFSFGIDPVFASGDGRTVAFQSESRLTPTDCDNEFDVFVASIDPWSLHPSSGPGCGGPPVAPGATSSPAHPPESPGPSSSQPDQAGSSHPAPERDAVPPEISVEAIRGPIDGRRLRRGINVAWTCDELCGAKIRLVAADTSLASVREPLGEGVRVTRLAACDELSRRACKRILAQIDRESLKLTIVAQDAAGNRGSRSLKLGR